jgi:O-antigen ligase
VSSPAAASAPTALTRPRPAVLRWPSASAWTTVSVAALLVVVAFAANGGLRLGETTKVEMGLLLLCGLGGAGAILATPDRGRWWGMGSVAAFALFAGWTLLSITWSVQPSDSWVEVNRTVTYLAAFAFAAALARTIPRQWEGVLAGIALASVVVSLYAVATKVLPGHLSADELYARLRAPFGYWNATGLFAALGVPSCLWLGARRHGYGPLNALAYPAVGILLVTQLLAYSRGTLLALAIGLIFWFAVVPLRLRGAAVLLAGLAGAIPLSLWAFARDGLSTDRLDTSLRGPAGHQLGILLAVMSVVLLAIGLAVTFRAQRTPLSKLARGRIGTTLLVGVVLIPIVFGGYLFTTERGFGGSISHAWTTLTDPNAFTPPNDPSRLTAIGSVRSRYWNEALKTFKDHPWKGVGAEGYATVRPFYRQDTLDVLHAHGFAVQTLADLGAIGMALALAILAAWGWATAKATGLRRRDRGLPFGPERIGLLTMTSTVVVFGVHSFVDWTWFVPGCTLVALLCSGWVVGRGPLRTHADAAREPTAPLRGPRAWLRAPGPLIGAVAVVVLALVLTWGVWQPLRSLDATNDALAQLEQGDYQAAIHDAYLGNDRNPLSLEPLSVLAVAQAGSKDLAGAEATLQREVRMQPANPDPWVRLADFQFNRLHKPKEALVSLQAAVRLDPRNPQTLGAYLVVLHAAQG